MQKFNSCYYIYSLMQIYKKNPRVFSCSYRMCSQRLLFLLTAIYYLKIPITSNLLNILYNCYGFNSQEYIYIVYALYKNVCKQSHEQQLRDMYVYHVLNFKKLFQHNIGINVFILPCNVLSIEIPFSAFNVNIS